jgi:hypothetical protein
MLEVINLAETKQTEAVVISSEPNWKKENIVKRKTIVYETSMDPTVARVAGERLKKELFTRYGFLKPKSNEIQFVSSEKFYEPYVVASGRYFIDYYRRSSYVFKVDDAVREVVILNNKFIPEGSKYSRSIKLDGEERLIHEAKSFLIMDRNGQDAQVDNLPSAPSEKKPEKAIAEYAIEELPENLDVDLVRAKVASRPREISRIVEEIFEVTERTVIYAPRFRMVFKNIAANEERTLILDGVSSRRIGP